MPEKKISITDELTKRQNDNIRRIRVLEESIRNVDERVNNFEQRFIQEVKKTYDRIEELNKKIKDMDVQLKTLSFQQDTLKKNEKKHITMNDLNQLKNYIDLISPISSKYVTKKEMQYYLKMQRQKRE